MRRNKAITNQKIMEMLKAGKTADDIAQVAFRYEGLFLTAYFAAGTEKQKKRVEQLRNRINKHYEQFHKNKRTHAQGARVLAPRRSM